MKLMLMLMRIERNWCTKRVEIGKATLSRDSFGPGSRETIAASRDCHERAVSARYQSKVVSDGLTSLRCWVREEEKMCITSYFTNEWDAEVKAIIESQIRQLARCVAQFLPRGNFLCKHQS